MRGVQQESALHADAMGGQAPNREILVDATGATADHDTLKHLNALAGAFNHLGVHAHRVARAKIGDIRLELFSLNFADDLGDH